MRPGSVLAAALLVLLAGGCVSFAEPPQVFVMNLYSVPVSLKLLQGKKTICVFDNIGTGAVQAMKPLPQSGRYATEWKTMAMNTWQRRRPDDTFPDLSTGEYCFEPGLIYLLFVDRIGLVKIIHLNEKSGYGARVCLFNAARTDIAGFSLIGDEAVRKPFLELRRVPAESFTSFITIVPGTARPILSRLSGLAAVPSELREDATVVDFEDRSYHFFLVRDTPRGTVTTHFILDRTEEERSR